MGYKKRMSHYYLACDLGAESGRLVLGKVSGGELEMKEIHRFANRPVRTGASLHWDVEKLWEGILEGLGRAARLEVKSVSCDSWGVDYMLVDGEGRVMEPVYHYRDGRTARGMERVLSQVSRATIFAETGIQHMPINTLFQLAAEESGRLGRARTLLGIGDAFNHRLGGLAMAEESLASTFQLFHPVRREWSERLCRAAGLPEGFLPQVVEGGRLTGTLGEDVQRRTGLGAIGVVAGCSHDTAAAVAAAPLSGTDAAYLSSGTWSLLGMERREPLLGDRCRELNFTNEIGAEGTIRLLKNLAGLWPLQECRRLWTGPGRECTYEEMLHLAEEEEAFASLVDLDHPDLVAPGDMREEIAERCRAAGEPVPASVGAFVRCILESLALLYARTVDELESLTGQSIGTLHVVGGGSRNRLLDRMSAEALGRPVIAGPAEATAAGNVGIQAMAAGEVENLEALRKLTGKAGAPETFAPGNEPGWAEAKERFEALCRKS